MELILNDIRQLILEARQQVLRSVNSTMVSTYWHIGKRIIEDEQDGQKRAKYATEMLKHLSQELSKEFGEGFSQTNLRQMRHFFLAYPIQQMPSAELDMPKFPHPRISWSHYLFLMRLKDAKERAFYEIETAENMWNLKELKRQFNSALYQRLALSRDKEGILALSREGWTIENPADAIKEPMILEFLGLESRPSYTEEELESAIIDQLEDNTQIFASQYDLVLPSKEDFIKILKKE